MSVRTMARVWAESRHSGTNLLMLLAIADFADDNGNAYPAVGTLAEKCRMSARNVNFILAELRASGELLVRPNEGPRGTNRYCIQQCGNCQALKQPSPLKPTSPLKPASSTPEAGFPKPLKPTSDKPSLNHHEPPSLVRVGAKRKGSKAEHPLFAEFYAAYPRKVDRLGAAKAFAALDPDANTLKRMVAAIGAQGLVERCAGPDSRFVPHPATWINRRRWEDQPSRGAADHDVFAGAL